LKLPILATLTIFSFEALHTSNAGNWIVPLDPVADAC
jgi:hypothetical protein